MTADKITRTDFQWCEQIHVPQEVSMTPALFLAACEAVWGARWQAPAAATLGVNRRTVARWLAGEYPIPAYVPMRLMAALRIREAVISEAIIVIDPLSQA